MDGSRLISGGGNWHWILRDDDGHRNIQSRVLFVDDVIREEIRDQTCLLVPFMFRDGRGLRSALSPRPHLSLSG